MLNVKTKPAFAACQDLLSGISCWYTGAVFRDGLVLSGLASSWFVVYSVINFSYFKNWTCALIGNNIFNSNGACVRDRKCRVCNRANQPLSRQHTDLPPHFLASSVLFVNSSFHFLSPHGMQSVQNISSPLHSHFFHFGKKKTNAFMNININLCGPFQTVTS